MSWAHQRPQAASGPRRAAVLGLDVSCDVSDVDLQLGNPLVGLSGARLLGGDVVEDLVACVLVGGDLGIEVSQGVLELSDPLVVGAQLGLGLNELGLGVVGLVVSLLAGLAPVLDGLLGGVELVLLLGDVGVGLVDTLIETVDLGRVAALLERAELLLGLSQLGLLVHELAVETVDLVVEITDRGLVGSDGLLRLGDILVRGLAALDELSLLGLQLLDLAGGVLVGTLKGSKLLLEVVELALGVLSVGLLALQEILGLVKLLLDEILADRKLGCVVLLLQPINLALQAGNALAGVVDLLLGTSDLELELLDLVLVTALLVLELVDLLVDLGDLLLVVRSGGGVVNDLLVLGEIGTGLILLALQIGNLALGVGDGLLEVLDLLGLGVDLILRSVLGLGGVKLLVEILEIILQVLDVGLGVFGLLLGVRLLGVETLALVLPLVELGRVEVNGLLLLLGVGLGVLEFLRLALANLEVGVELALGLLTSDVEALNGLVGIGNDVLGFLELGDVLVMVLGESIDLVVDVSEVGLELGDVLVSGGIVKSILGVGEGRLLLVDDLLAASTLSLSALWFSWSLARLSWAALRSAWALSTAA